MKFVKAYLRLFDNSGNTIINTLVQLEYFDFERAAWSILAEKKTTKAGNITFELTLNSDTQAPWLRLSLPLANSSHGCRPLTYQAHVSYNEKTETLTADFGEVYRIEGDLPLLKSTQKQFQSTPEPQLALADRPWLDKQIDEAISVKLEAIKQNEKVLAATNLRAQTSDSTTINTAASTDNNPAPTLTPMTTGGRTNTSSTAIINDALSAGTDTTGANTLDVFHAQLVQFAANEERLKRDLLLSKFELETLQQTLKETTSALSSRTHELQKIESQYSELTKQTEALINQAKAATPINDLASTIGEQIAAANQFMSQEAQPYRIENVQLELRGNLLDAGKSISLSNTLDSAIQAQTNAVVRLDLIAERAVTKTALLRTPDISGLTKSAAERLLNTVGLRLHALSEPITDTSKAVVGQVLRQSPVAGKEVSPQTLITAVFASASKEYL